ncbi:cyclase family protein [Anaerofustis sp.]|uniref:cyclase family protein n=1 Tax=Anaerofustis sp. TaxID=1872517 RepID=UPI0025BEB35F|nr:cyclase family protein [Anaerofustis sp.]
MQLIDLTREIADNMQIYPKDPNVYIKNYYNHKKDGCKVDEIHISSHSGTHLDVPYHILENGKDINDYPINKFIGKGIVVDVSGKSNNEIIYIDDLASYEKNILNSDFVIFKTGYDKFFNSEKYTHHPYLSKEIITFLKDIGISIFGIDTLSPDSTYMGNNDAHKTLLSNDILIVENLTNLDALNCNVFYNFYFIPMKIKNGDGAPVRAFAKKL